MPWNGEVGRKVKAKLHPVLDRNPAWPHIKAIEARLRGEEEGELPEEWTVQDAFAMQFAPITSVDVERAFSKLKHILSDKRTRLTVDNLGNQLMLFYNQDEDSDSDSDSNDDDADVIEL